MTHWRRVTCVAHQQQQAQQAQQALPQPDGVLYTGGEDGALMLWDMRSGTAVQRVERAHATRLRGLVALTATVAARSGLASASSDGIVRMWDERMLGVSGAARCVPTLSCLP